MTCTAATHADAVADPAQWSAWHFVGYQADGDRVLEMRDCPACLSTCAKTMRGYRWDAEARKPVARYVREFLPLPTALRPFWRQ